MKLQRIEDTRVVKIDSSSIRRRKREIRHTGMKFAEVSGNCCWEVRDRYDGGEYKHLKSVDNHELPWDIKSIRLTSCKVE